MTLLNPARAVNLFLCLIFLLLVGCAKQPVKQAYVAKTAPKIQPTTEIAASQQGKPKPLTGANATIWDRLISLYALPPVNNERIERELQKYLSNPEYLISIQRRAAPYLYFILDEIEARQLPGELALLPAIESAFLPHALSGSKAAGLWQFMPATGRDFGLKQNEWYDGRNDIYASTRAAATYLKQLAKLFDDDWFLALAAYNAGQSNIKQARQKNSDNNQPTDYWSIHFRGETMGYVPRLLAMAKIFANADEYNIPLRRIPNQPYFEVVMVDSQIDLSLAAKMAQIPINKFFILNPGYKRLSTAPEGPHRLLIHAHKVKEFTQRLTRTDKADRVKNTRYKIKRGDSLSRIAKQYHTTVNALRASNGLASNKIRAGDFLYIPCAGVAQIYIVKKGDTLWGIARQFAVRSKDIADWNNISLTEVLRPGQRLITKQG